IRNELLVGCISLSPRALQKSRRAGREELAQVSLRVEGKPLKRPDAFENGAFDDQDLFVRWHAVLRRVSRRTANGVPLTGPPLQAGLGNRLGKCLPGLADGRRPGPVAEHRHGIADSQRARQGVQLAVVVTREAAFVAGGGAKPMLELARAERLELR